MRTLSAFGVAGLTAATLVACAPPPERTGQALFADYCVTCHGDDGTGGVVAETLGRPVPDLTSIAARNGDVFPYAYVIDTIDGYTRSRAGNATMPEFGIELEAGKLVRYDHGDGLPKPTPERLVALAEYLASIQQ